MQDDISQKKNMKRVIVKRQHNQLNVWAIKIDDYESNLIFIDEKKKENNDEEKSELKIFSNILITSTRTNAFKFDVSWIEQSKSIVKRQNNDQKFAISKTIKFENWMKINSNETFNAFSREQSFKLIDQSKKENKDFIFRNQC